MGVSDFLGKQVNKVFTANEKDTRQRKMKQNVLDNGKIVMQLAISGQLLKSDINNLEKMYNDYYDKYPEDANNRDSSIKKLHRLRAFAKK